MKQIKCRTCGKMVSSKAKRCKHCGTLLKMPILGIVIVSAFILFVIGIIVIGILQSG